MNDKQKGTPGSSGTGTAANESQPTRRIDSIAATTVERKMTGRETARSKRYLPNFVPCIDDKTKRNIVYAWDILGTPPREIAMNLNLTVIQVDAVIHEQRRTTRPVDPVTPSVLESRRLHVVAMRRAA